MRLEKAIDVKPSNCNKATETPREGFKIKSIKYEKMKMLEGLVL